MKGGGGDGGGGGSDPRTAPLVQGSDITYVGAFALEDTWTGAYGTFQYGGSGVSFYADPAHGASLFLSGHVQGGSIAGQVAIPPKSALVKSSDWAALPMGTTIQSPQEACGGKMEEIDPTNTGNPFRIYGFFVDSSGRLIVGADNAYSATQTDNVFVHATASLSSPVLGPYHFNPQNPTQTLSPVRAQMGYMAPVPEEWQPLLGGAALAGNGDLSIISTTSCGASANVFRPDDIGNVPTPSETTLLWYDSSDHEMCGASCESDQISPPSTTWNITSQIKGIFFVPHTRTVAFAGIIGFGCYWYGGQDDGIASGCPANDSMQGKGPHAPPYHAAMWLYDAEDLLAVAGGTKAAYQPKPYAFLQLPDVESYAWPNDNLIAAATYDPSTGLIYFVQDYGTQPRVEVFQVAQF